MKPCFNVRFFRKSIENYNIHFVTSEVMLAMRYTCFGFY